MKNTLKTSVSPIERTETLIAIGDYYSENLPRNKSTKISLYYYNQALASAIHSNDTSNIGYSYWLISKTYRLSYNYEQSLEILFKAEQFAKSKSNLLAMLSSLYGEVVLVYLQTKNYTLAQKFLLLRKQTELRRKEKMNYRTIAGIYNNMALIYIKKNMTDSAILNLNRSLYYIILQKSEEDKSTVYCNLAKCYLLKKDFRNAKHYADLTIKNAQTTKDSLTIAEAQTYLGETYLNLLDLKKAAEAFLFTTDTYRYNIQDCIDCLGAYEGMSTIYVKKGDYKRAHSYAIKYNELSRQLANDDKKEKLNQMESTAALNNKQNEIEILNKNNQLAQLDARRQKTLMYGLIISLFFIVVSGLVLYKNYSNNKRASKAIKKRNELITESITYAKRIQDALLPQEAIFNSYFSDSVIFYQPKDIVSGDLYWCKPLDGNKLLFALADCTGHGVPGALMTILSHSFLDKAIINNEAAENIKPSDVLNELNNEIKNNFVQKSQEDIRDGLDIAVGLFDKQTKKLLYAGSRMSLFYRADSELNELKTSRVHIGYTDHVYETHEIQLKKNDVLFLFSDGFHDQKGGESAKILNIGRFKKALVDLSLTNESANQVKEEMRKFFHNWKGNLEQMDDVLVLGLKV